MLATLLLFAFLAIATVTDLRTGKIYNRTTYTGIVIAMIASSVASALGVDAEHASAEQARLWGFVPITDCLAGFAVCGVMLLGCYVFFPGGVGGGDLKLIAMMGAFLGLYPGLEAMLWTLVLGACLALVIIVWRAGAIWLVTRAGRYVLFRLRLGAWTPLTADDRALLKPELRLSPSALAAAVIVKLGVFSS